MSDSDDNELVLCHLYQVLCSDLPSCGCGWPGEANRLVHAVLSLMPTYGAERKQQLAELIGPEGSQQLVLCTLEKTDLIRHGVSVDSAYLAPRGRWVLWAVERVGGIDAVARGLDGAGFPHDFGEECTENCWTVPDDWRPRPADVPSAPAAQPSAWARLVGDGGFETGDGLVQEVQAALGAAMVEDMWGTFLFGPGGDRRWSTGPDLQPPDAIDRLLHAFHNPPEQDGPPWVHTFRQPLPEEAYVEDVDSEMVLVARVPFPPSFTFERRPTFTGILRFLADENGGQ